MILAFQAKFQNISHFNIPKIQERLDNKNVSTTMIYTHIIDTGGHGVRSPVDGL